MYVFSAKEHFIPLGTGVLGVEDLDAAPAVHGEYLCVKPCVIKRLMFNISEAVLAATTAPQVRFSKRVLQGSDTGAVVLGSLTLPSGAAVGEVYYKDIDPVQFQVGDTLKVENTVQTVDPGSGTETGQGYYAFEADESPEEAVENSEMIESA
jgi:hypothetical protein